MSGQDTGSRPQLGLGMRLSVGDGLVERGPHERVVGGQLIQLRQRDGGEAGVSHRLERRALVHQEGPHLNQVVGPGPQDVHPDDAVRGLIGAVLRHHLRAAMQ